MDVVLLSVGADLPYFTGYEATPSERLTVLVVRPESAPAMIIPRLELARVESPGIEVHSWDEIDDPIALAAGVGGAPSRVAVGDHMWSAFLVGFQQRWPEASWEKASSLTGELRLVKDSEEVDCLRNAAHGVDRAMARIPAEVRFIGRTEAEIARDLREITVEEGHDVAEFAIVGSGPNSASPHHEPGSRVVEEGDVIVCDFGGRWGGYYSDSTRTFVAGEPSERQVEVHAAVLAANRAGREKAGPGVRCQDVDAAARSVMADAGLDEYFIHRTGHGIGMEVHEHPYIVDGNDMELRPGMAFSVEPGAYIAGDFGVRIEDIVVCIEAGVETLNESDRSLVGVA